MATVKRPVKKVAVATARKKPPLAPYTTIRMIENAGPCALGYRAFLRDFGGRPISFGSRFGSLMNGSTAKVRIGPDDHISLRDILNRKSSDRNRDAASRVHWLVSNSCVLPTGMDTMLAGCSGPRSAYSVLGIAVLTHCDTPTLAKIMKDLQRT